MAKATRTAVGLAVGTALGTARLASATDGSVVGITPDSETFLFYDRTAIHSAARAHETFAAQDADYAVRQEINRFNRESQPR